MFDTFKGENSDVTNNNRDSANSNYDSDYDSDYDRDYDDPDLSDDEEIYDTTLKKYPKIIQSMIEKQMRQYLLNQSKIKNKLSNHTCSICLEKMNKKCNKLYHCPFGGKHPIDKKCFDKFVESKSGICFICK